MLKVFGLSYYGFVKMAALCQPMRSKSKPIVCWSHAFSRAWRYLHAFASSSDWFIALFTSVVIGQSNCLGLRFTTLNKKPLLSEILPTLR